MFETGLAEVDCSMPDKDLFNEAQQRRLLAYARHADQLLSDIEDILTASGSTPAFPKYRPDVSLHQARLIRSHIARFRTHLVHALAAAGVRYEGPQFGSLHSIRVALTFVRIAVQEMAPERLRGYGGLTEEAAAELRGVCSELEGLLNGLERNLALGEAADLQARLDRLQRTGRETELLRLLDRIVGENELAEFRSPLLDILEKVESRQFEIAVFGRVSSGKSSLLNHILHTEILPAGVNPVTAVPARLVAGREALLSITFADRQVKHCPIGELALYASEERNPGNRLGVTRLTVRLPNPRLQDGLVLVDTPGLGSLAAAGAAETLAYLPRCDLGILLISAATPIDGEDLNTIQALSQADIPVMVLLSKADLLPAEDRIKALAYTKQEIAANLNLSVAVHPVSTAPGYEEMLESWFRTELAPLCDRRRELAEQSVRRKAGALREAVLAALRSQIGRPVGSAPSDPARLEEIERGLREAAGSLEEARRFYLSAADEVRSLGSIAIERAAAAAAQSWNGGYPPASGAALAPATIRETAAEAAARISARLRAVAKQLDSALDRASRELGGVAGDSPLEDCLREMPRFEAAFPEIPLNPPWFRFLKSLARYWALREIRRRLEAPLGAAFANYGRSLEDWSRRALGEMQGGFEARADAYRAQVARLTAGGPVAAGDRMRIESAIAMLEGFAPTDAGGEVAPPGHAPDASECPESKAAVERRQTLPSHS